MRKTLSIRLSEELAEWLEKKSRSTGLPQGRIVRDELDAARLGKSPRFLRHAGRLTGPRDLSSRKGFAKK